MTKTRRADVDSITYRHQTGVFDTLGAVEAIKIVFSTPERGGRLKLAEDDLAGACLELAGELRRARIKAEADRREMEQTQGKLTAALRQARETLIKLRDTERALAVARGNTR